MSGSFCNRIFSEVAVVIVESYLEVLEIFTHISQKFELRSFKIRHLVSPLLSPFLGASISNRTSLFEVRTFNMADWRTYPLRMILRVAADQQLFLVGMICLLTQEHFLWPLETLISWLRLNKGFMLFNFLQSASWIWITKIDFLLSVNMMVL